VRQKSLFVKVGHKKFMNQWLEWLS